MEFQEATAEDTTALVPEIENNGQGYVVGTVFARVGDYKVRAEVRSGTPPLPSWGRAAVWSPSALTWNELYALPKLKTPKIQPRAPIDPALFAKDLAELLSVARAILL